MSWFASNRAAQLLVGAALYALAWWLVAAAVVTPDLPRGENPDRFAVARFHAEYQVERDSDGTAAMNVVETIDAEYADGSSSGRLARTLPINHQGRASNIARISVLHDGSPVEFEIIATPTSVQLLIGSASQAKPGTYEIRYRYQGVVLNDGPGQQFHWDINGDSWRQRIDEVSATITFAPDLAAHLTGTARCSYQRSRSSTEQCEVGSVPNPDGSVTYTSSAVVVRPGKTQTVSIGLAAGTANPPPLTASTTSWLKITGLIAGGLTLGVGFALYWAASRRRRALGDDPGVVQFTPRDDLPPILAAALMGTPGRGVVAEVLRAAHEGYVQLRGGQRGAPLRATLTAWPNHWQVESQVTLDQVLRTRQRGVTVDLGRGIPRLGGVQVGRLRALPVREGLIRRPAVASWTLIAAGALITPIIIVPGVSMALPAGWIITAMLVVAVALAVGYGLALRWERLTPRGQMDVRYLNGLRMFLQASESERIKMVQGADTSMRVGPKQLIPIVEKLLPYAVALGVEDSWQRAVGTNLNPTERLPPDQASSTGGGR